jgi:hypothetical protein
MTSLSQKEGAANLGVDASARVVMWAELRRVDAVRRDDGGADWPI